MSTSTPAEATPKKKSDLIPRMITAIVAIPLLLGLILKGPAWAFFALIAAAGSICAWEYCDITCGRELPLLKPLTALLTAGVMSAAYLVPGHLLHALCAATIAIFLVVLFAHQDQPRTSHHIGSALTGIVYGGLLVCTLALMRQFAGEAGPCWVIMALAIIWGSDTGAYFAGRALGKRKLSPKVSPNKSVEGALGGLVTSVLFCAGFNALFTQTHDAWVALTLPQVLLLSIPGNILGQLGDLCESLIKRAHQVKDSGVIIYGHGGMLDRIDALILASPWFYVFVTTLGPQAPGA